ncbi:CLUMA_CG013231, isoform A [Clunio marinus]|uniref:CLUMA_CG013231, isoform A n=1 Tax=Clunio marinus TaxID=568069 RepID=A0A1J1II96_9DIPT|nr:CLUMA_CG013231, isoform A [Clunio marinus]
MADLDDFFAKRDKKKKTKKFLSSEELVKQLEQPKEPVKTKPSQIEEETEQQITNEENDDEWINPEPEKRPDYSNLKLGQLTINEDDEQGSSGNFFENESSQNDGDSSENPWKSSGSSGPPPPQESSTKPKVVPPSNTGIYIPSFLRAENAQKLRSKKNAPDLSAENFPSLGTEKPVKLDSINKKDGFEAVKHGGKLQAASSGNAPVTTENSFSSLVSDSLDS